MDLVCHLLSNGVVAVSEEVGDGDGGRVGLGALRGWVGGLTVSPTVEEEYVWGGRRERGREGGMEGGRDGGREGRGGERGKA